MPAAERERRVEIASKSRRRSVLIRNFDVSKREGVGVKPALIEI